MWNKQTLAHVLSSINDTRRKAFSNYFWLKAKRFHIPPFFAGTPLYKGVREGGGTFLVFPYFCNYSAKNSCRQLLISCTRLLLSCTLLRISYIRPSNQSNTELYHPYFSSFLCRTVGDTGLLYTLPKSEVWPLRTPVWPNDTSSTVGSSKHCWG